MSDTIATAGPSKRSGLPPTPNPTNAANGLIVCTPAVQGAVAAPKNARPRKASETARTRGASTEISLIEMLKRHDGATIGEIPEALVWQPHTVCGAMTGALKRRLGLTILSDKVDGRGRVYLLA